MSVVGTADLVEVVLAADRFDWLPFAADVLFWAVLFALAWRLVRRAGRPGGSRG